MSLMSKGLSFECHFGGGVRTVTPTIYTYIDKVDKSADIFHDKNINHNDLLSPLVLSQHLLIQLMSKTRVNLKYII